MTTAPATQAVEPARIDEVRRFNRFYTRQIGVLQEGLLRSAFSLTEARVLYELAHRERPTAADVARALGLDAGYLSRILRGFEERGLVDRTASPTDARQQWLALTGEGREAFAALDARSRDEIEAMLGALDEGDQRRLVAAMRTIGALLRAEPESRPGEPPFRLRSHEPGDLGWIVQRHGALYAQEYGWDERFEALVARIAADFLDRFDARGERCWIAERDGEPVGSVLLVRHPDLPETVAKLRLLLVEPWARGLGIGRELVRECTRFARQAGYQRITLWTNSVLHAARRIYEQEGYRLVREEPHRSFGHDLVGQTWELEL